VDTVHQCTHEGLAALCGQRLRQPYGRQALKRKSVVWGDDVYLSKIGLGFFNFSSTQKPANPSALCFETGLFLKLTFFGETPTVRRTITSRTV